MELGCVERPPRFRADEVVRIVSATGENEYLDGRFRFKDPEELVWSRRCCLGRPPRDRSPHWRIGLRSLYLREGVPFSVFEQNRDDLAEDVYSTMLDVAEEQLESTGMVEQWGGEVEGPPSFVPLEQATVGWRDHLDIKLFALLGQGLLSKVDPEKLDWDAMDVVKQAAAAAAFELAGSNQDADWRWYYPWLVYPAGDVAAAYARLTAAPAEGWIHSYDDKGWPLSGWHRPASSDDVFLDRGIDNAEVTCRSYASPKRLTRPNKS